MIHAIHGKIHSILYNSFSKALTSRFYDAFIVTKVHSVKLMEIFRKANSENFSFFSDFKMRVCRHRRLIKISLCCCFIWLTVILYLYSDLGQSIETFWDGMAGISETKLWLKKQMAATSNHQSPLSYLLHPNLQQLSFLYLPKRLFTSSFTEVTSANRDTSYPLAPDFTFHIEYHDRSVVLYEDYGPGCVFR